MTHEQVVEVHGAGTLQSRLVLGVDLGDLAVVDDLGALGGVVRAAAVVLQRGHRCVHRTWREALRVDAQIADDVAGEPHGVGLVVDRELRGIAEQLCVAPQDAHTGRVERGDPHALGDGADEAGDALAHLCSGLVGEGDREHLVRRDLVLLDEVRDAVREHPGLARARAGDDEQRPAGVGDRLELGRVQALEEVVAGHPGNPTRGVRQPPGAAGGAGGRCPDRLQSSTASRSSKKSRTCSSASRVG